MKKITNLLLCFFLLALGACVGNDDTLTPLGNNMYRLTVAPENTVNTRADAPGQSGLKARYILEIYTSGENGELYQRFVQSEDPVFDFRLITSQTYDFLVWVDYSANGVDDNHYNAADLKNITLKTGDIYYNNDHSRDAFFGVLKGQRIETTSKDFGAIVCKRPFGQLNIKTTDWTHTNSVGGNNDKIKPTSINMKFTAPSTFDVSTGMTSEDYSFEYDYTLNISDQNSDVQALTCDYILAPQTGAAQVSPVIVFLNGNGEEVTNTAEFLTNLPVKRNYQTNVSGKLISKQGEVIIDVDQEWNKPILELTRPAGETASFHIKKDDPRYHPSTGVYEIDPTQIGAQDGTVLLVFEGDFPKNITIVIPDNFPAGVGTIIIDVNKTVGTPNITINNSEFSGIVSLRNELPTNNPTTEIGDLNIHLPSGSFTLGSGLTIFGNLDIWTKPGTFMMEEGSVINGTLTVRGGRAILKGEVKGEIFAMGNSMVDIVKDGVTKSYYTQAITQKSVSGWYGFGVGVNDVVGLAISGFALPDFLDLSFRMNYAGAYAAFDFGNHTNGLNWQDLRNVRYDFIGTANNVVGSAKLKKDLNITYATPADLQAAMNKPVNDLKAELNSKMAQLNKIVADYNKLPHLISAPLLAEVKKLQAAVDYFNGKLPTVQLPANAPQIPLATVLPAGDNFDFAGVTQIIGKPGDKFNILDIPGYIDGSKSLTLYMVIDFMTQYKDTETNAASLKAEKAELEAEKSTLAAEKARLNAQIEAMKATQGYITLDNQLKALVAEYDAMAKPANGPKNVIGIPSWVFVPATKADDVLGIGNKYFVNKWSVAYGSPSASEITRMNNCNAKIDAIEAKVAERDAYYYQQTSELGSQVDVINSQIKIIDNKINGTLGNLFLDGLNAQILAADAQVTVFQAALDQLGISKETVDQIVNIVMAVEPYLGAVADVADTINNTMVKIQGYNPWEYPVKVGSKTTIAGMKVTATFEYEAGKKLLYLIRE